MDLPERIDLIRGYGIMVSDDGFYPTPTGPIHVDDSDLCRALLDQKRLEKALQMIADRPWSNRWMFEVQDVARRTLAGGSYEPTPHG